MYIPGRKRKKLEEAEKKEVEKDAAISRKPQDLDIEKLRLTCLALEKANGEIRESQIEMILSFAIAAEHRDADTGNHILRISDYATQLGRRLGLTEDELELLRYASPMHDIGKIAIPDNILQKKGRLTVDEFEVMKQHTVIGSRMFQNTKSALLKAAAQIAISHHERFDGSGYPHQVTGEKIPLFGRVVAIVDVFDAVVSKRCYKEASPFDEGLEYLKTLKGHHLDPHLVDIFIKDKHNVHQIYQANKHIESFVTECSNTTNIEELR